MWGREKPSGLVNLRSMSIGVEENSIFEPGRWGVSAAPFCGWKFLPAFVYAEGTLTPVAGALVNSGIQEGNLVPACGV